jgi:hypothetical protein
MGVRWLRWLPFCGEKKKGPKSINIFLGFFFMVNFCLGTGFLGVPFSFFYAGYLAAIPTLLVIAFVSWNNAEWEVETMARAQAIELWQRQRDGSETVQSDSDSERESLISSGTSSTAAAADVAPHPKYEIRLSRKFEPTELCEIFLTRWGKAAYMVILTVYCFLVCWSFTTVAGSAWATNIPFSSASLARCDSDDFLHVLIPPTTGCRNAYMLCVFLFAVITVPLCLVDLREQAVLQMILGLLRFVTIAGIVLYAIVSLGKGGNECLFSPNSTFVNTSFSNLSWWKMNETAGFGDLSRIVFRFDAIGWLVSIPVFAYAFILHQGIPALTHPIREKHLLRELMSAMFGIAVISYLSLGVVVPLWFKADIQETCTLNWVDTAKAGSPAVRALSYYLVLFPSIDVTSAYPLVVHTISNNIYTTLFCRDTSRKSKTPKLDFLLQLLIKFVSAVLPIAAALFVSNLVYVLKYAGLTGFFISFFFPTALQLSSIWKCSKIFPPHPPPSDGGHSQKIPLKGQKRIYDLQSGSLVADAKPVPTVSVGSRLSQVFASYRTPYSHRILSHPVAVVAIGAVGVILFLLTLASLAVHPQQLHCSSEL